MSRSTAPPAGERLTLSIEVSNPSADAAASPASPSDVLGPSVALSRGIAILDQEALRTTDNRHDDDLMPAIDRLVRRAGYTPFDLRLIAISIGPGGFTGLRVAIATAKALGEVIAMRHGPAPCCIPVPSARVVAANHTASQGQFAVALASKRDNCWLTVLDAKRSPLPDASGSPGVLATAADVESLHRTHNLTSLIADRFLPEPIRLMASRLGVPVLPPLFSAAGCARVALGIDPVDPASLAPLYPREPEAVTKWRALHPTMPDA